MKDDNNIEPKQDKVLSEVYEQFRCQHCNSVSQPISHTHLECPPEYKLLDIYACVWCDTGFVLTDTIDGYTKRDDLSQKLVASWNPCVF